MSIEGRAYDEDHHDKIAVEALRQRIHDLPGGKRARYAMLLQQAIQAGRSFSLSENKSHRRFEIARGLVLLLEDNQYDDGLVIGLCSDITFQQYKKPGEALANLDCAQAQQFAYACQGIKAGTLELVYNPKTNTTHKKEDSNV